jgi:predicted peptidase
MLPLLLLLLQPVDLGKTLPPPGIKIAEADRTELTAAVTAFGNEIEAARTQLANEPRLLALFPDVLIYHKAVDWALRYNEFYDAKEVKAARELLKQGRARLKQLTDKNPAYLEKTGLVVRGYLSKIDGSVQPYGLVIPTSYHAPKLQEWKKYRLDVWLHGRGDKLTELAFLDQRSRQPGEFTPADTFVLHPYGRYCNAFKFAGEVDVFEAMDHCKAHYRIDDKRQVIRGFSMGGAGCWHLAVHHPGVWAAAAPGAGFAETPEYTGAKLNEVPWWEQKLWHLYNATDYAENLKQVPTVAYSGENDKQKQAADVMDRELKKLDKGLYHLIGPKMGHKYDAESKQKIEHFLGGASAPRQNTGKPLTREPFSTMKTYTLRYAMNHHITIHELEAHWQPARVSVSYGTEIDGAFNQLLGKQTIRPWSTLDIKASNIADFTLRLEASEVEEVLRRRRNVKELQDRAYITVAVNQREYFPQLSSRDKNGDWTLRFRKINGEFELLTAPPPAPNTLQKKPGLQGPIDDAFMDSFLIVKPSGTSAHLKVNEWVEAEMSRAIDQWRRQFRGIPRIKLDTDVTPADIQQHHLILWGTPESNSVMKKLADKLPVQWGEQLVMKGKPYPGATTVPILIHPNPLNPARYVVLNSGHTFREESNRSNARQTPKLPDWAIIDITTPPNSYHPGKVMDAGFFNEAWK